MKLCKTQLSWTLLLIGLAACNSKQTTQEEADPMTILVGTYTNQESKGIYHLNLNPETGELSAPALLAETPNPSFLVRSKDGNTVFAVNEEEEGMVTGFRFDEAREKLTQTFQLPTGGMHPCYIDLNEAEDRLVVANYSSGNVSFYKLEGGGSAKMFQIFQHRGSGPQTDRQEGPHAHCAIFHDRFAYAVDLGTDEIMAYSQTPEGIGVTTVALKQEAGDGPRHLVFGDGGMAFAVNELSNTVVSLRRDPADGSLNPISRVGTLPEDFTEHSQCADIQLSPNGRFLYASNRGHDSIAIFSVSEAGELERLGTESTKGEWPRNFAISPDGRFLLVANQYTNNIVVFAIDQETGLLSYTGHQAEVASPVCLRF